MKKLVVFRGESIDRCSPLYLEGYKLSESGELLGGYVVNGRWELVVNEHGWFIAGSERADTPEFVHLQFIETDSDDYEIICHDAEVLMRGLDPKDHLFSNTTLAQIRAKSSNVVFTKNGKYHQLGQIKN